MHLPLVFEDGVVVLVGSDAGKKNAFVAVHYSVAYFVSSKHSSAERRAHTHCVIVVSIHEFTQHV